MSPPSLCGSFLRSRRHLVAFVWTFVCILTLLAIVLALVASLRTHTQYAGLERYYSDLAQQQQYGNNNAYQDEEEQRNNYEQELEFVRQLSSVTSKSMVFTCVYTLLMSLALSLFGSTAIVGFFSIQGVYIPPCFQADQKASTFRLGIFGGAVVFFANLLMLIAIVFGEVRVADDVAQDGDHKDQQQQQNEPYQLERIATILAVMCMFLAALYIVFALLLFLYFVDEQQEPGDVDVVDDEHPTLRSLRGGDRPDAFTVPGTSVGK